MSGYLCADCLAAGVVPDYGGLSGSHVVACAFCGAVDETATYQRNAVDVIEGFGTLMNQDGTSNVQFWEYREKLHEEFIDRLLDAYLIDPHSRVVSRPADNFMTGARSWYNRFRSEDAKVRGLKHSSTNVAAQKVKYQLLVAIHVAILESNIVVANNRLSHVKPPEPPRPVASRGDGTIMAPSLHYMFARANALGTSHVGYIESLEVLRRTWRRTSHLRDYYPAVEITMAQVYVLSQRLQFLSRLPLDKRPQSFANKELKPQSIRRGVTIDSAQPDDYLLDSKVWDYVAKIDWDHTFETAYQLYCAQQVVSLWGNRCTIEMAIALLIWAAQARTGEAFPAFTGIDKELALPHGGNDRIVQRRRNELRDFFVGWSTSFIDAGLVVPILPPPTKGQMGNGLTGYCSDKRRAIPENGMAIAAAPVIAADWRRIMETRLRTRTQALPLDTEFTMAARMFAKAYDTAVYRKKGIEKAAKLVQMAKEKSRKLSERSKRRQAMSAPGSRYHSMEPRSLSSSPAPDRSSSQPLRGHPNQTRTIRTRVAYWQPREKSPSIEALLATREDSSDDGSGRDSDEEPEQDHKTGIKCDDSRGLQLAGLGPSAPFGFTIGPNGFLLASGNSDVSRTVSVGTQNALRPGLSSRKRPAPESSISELPATKRRPKDITVPMSPPATSPSSQSLSFSSRRRSQPSLSPALTTLTTTSRASSPHVIPSSPTPSLRSVTMSPTLTAVSVSELAPVPELESHITRHIGRLLRERDQYAYYNAHNSCRRGQVVSIEVERAMNDWVAKKQLEGPLLPPGLKAWRDHPRRPDVGPIIRQLLPTWSPAETLLRLGVRPKEFPRHFIVHSVLDLEQKLGHFRWEDRLAPMGEEISAAQVDAELDLLFSVGPEKLSDILATPAEVAKRERLVLKEGIWSYPRDVPEGPKGSLDERPRRVPQKTSGRGLPLAGGSPVKGSRRINYEALKNLVEGDDEEDGEDEVGLGEVLHETLWDAVAQERDVIPEDDSDEEDGDE